MNILVVTMFDIPHVGGLSTHVQLLLEGLKRRGHTVRLVAGRDTQVTRLAKGFAYLLSGFNRDRYRAAALGRRVAAIGKKVRRCVAEQRPDVIHTHDAIASAAVVSVLGPAVPLVQTVHGPALYEVRSTLGGAWIRYLAAIESAERSAFAGVDSFITVDSGQARILVDDYGVDRGRIQVIFNCVDEKEIRSLASEAAPLDLPSTYFLVPRRLVPKTGVRYAIEAMPRLRSADARLLIAGDGPQRAELEQLSRALGLGERVQFLGGVERGRLMPLFARASAVVVPSIPSEGVIEATSLAVTEAMAAGTVPVASGIGGLAELIEDGVTGLLVPPGNAAELAGALQSLLDDPKRRTQLVEAASRKVETDYSSSAWLRAIEAVYERASAKKP